MPQHRLPRSPSDIPSNREIINKIENDITLLRGEVMELKVLLTKLLETKKKESSGWIFS
jgi:hypothetical protein